MSAVFACLGFAETTLAECLPTGRTEPEPAVVSYVYDGDTVKLDDGRKVRIAGINSPETAHRGNLTAEPFADAARDALQTFLAQHQHRISLHLAPASRDRYGRWLADIQLPDGRNLAEMMIEQGLAVQSAVGDEQQNPLAYCYRDTENLARQARLGLWQQPQFWLIDSTPLSHSQKRFVIVRDRISRARQRHQSWHITLQHGTRLSVALSAWSDRNPPTIGGTIEARGWLYRQNNTPTLRITHPANLTTGTPLP